MCCFGNIKIDSSAIYELHKRVSGARVKGSKASVSKATANKHNRKALGLIDSLDQLECPSVLMTGETPLYSTF